MSGRSVIFGQDDRDGTGRIAIGERALADLFPAGGPAPDAAPAQPGPRDGRLMSAGVAALIVLGLAVYALIGPVVAPTVGAGTPVATAPVSTPAPAAVVAPAATAAGCVITQTTPAFYAPAGAPAPLAIERGTACQVVAWHAGLPDWRQITIGGGAPVWVPLAVVSMASTAGLVDLAPPPTATPAPATQTPIVIVREVVVAPAPCTEQNASFRSRRDPRGNEPLVGYAVAWSCESQADADSKAEASFQDIMRGMP